MICEFNRMAQFYSTLGLRQMDRQLETHKRHNNLEAMKSKMREGQLLWTATLKIDDLLKQLMKEPKLPDE